MLSPVAVVRELSRRVGRTQEVAGLLIAAGGPAVALGAALLGWAWAAFAIIAASIIAEWILEDHAPQASKLAGQASLGPAMRFVLRSLAVLVTVSTGAKDDLVLVVGIIVSLYTGVMFVRSLHGAYRRTGPLKPMETLNIPGNPRIEDRPPKRTVIAVATQFAVLIPVAFDVHWTVIMTVGIAAITVLAAITLIDALGSWHLRKGKRTTGYTGPLRQIQDFLDDYRPEVALHLSGNDSAGYQVNMWLESLEALDRRVIILLRDRPLFRQLAETKLPVIALNSGPEFLTLDFSSLRVALYPTNTGNNIHLLRLPGMMSAFVGHGDSDKSASSNPFSRVYDELWVAGQAGADRYRRSGLGIDESRYRVVGRPQVHGILPTPRLGDEEVPTVLYAPTWEGVNKLQEYSSVRDAGLHAVRAFLDSPAPVRVVYKPHPFTGHRDPAFRRADERIEALLTQARASSGIEHRTVRSGDLMDWFNVASALITDISSVLSDFMASEKPVAVFNHLGAPEEEFRGEFPSAGAATVFGAQAAGIAELVEVVSGARPDTRRQARSELATYLLGTADQRTLESFGRGVDGLVERCLAERAQYHGESTSEEPVV